MAEMDENAIRKLLDEASSKENSYLKFAQEQIKADRENFEVLFRRTVWFLTFLLGLCSAIIVYFGIKTAADLKAEVSRQVRQEFAAESIHRTIQEEVRARMPGEFEKAIAGQVAITLRQQKAAIVSTAAEQVSTNVIRKLKPLNNDIELSHVRILGLTARGSRRSFEELSQLQPSLRNPEAKRLAAGILDSIRDEAVIVLNQMSLFQINDEYTENEKRMIKVRLDGVGPLSLCEDLRQSTSGDVELFLRMRDSRVIMTPEASDVGRRIIRKAVLTIDESNSLCDSLVAIGLINKFGRQRFRPFAYQDVKTWWTTHSTEFEGKQ